jgi:acyl carrier protein
MLMTRTDDVELTLEELDLVAWNVLIGIHKRLNVDIPESDYQSLRTLADLVDYVKRKAPQHL